MLNLDPYQNISSIYSITTMPVNSKIQDNTQERRIEFATKAFGWKEIPKLRKTASIYRVKSETPRCCVQGHPVGINWANNYVGRTPELRIAQSKRYDHQRAQREDPEEIRKHFRFLKSVAHKYGI